jgi:uncharacterized DUF497 family protein
MKNLPIKWDFPNDPNGNYAHITDGHDVTVDEVEEVLRDPSASRTKSRRPPHRPMAFGWTSTGQYICVVYEVHADGLYPKTAYPVTPPGGY